MLSFPCHETGDSSILGSISRNSLRILRYLSIGGVAMVYSFCSSRAANYYFAISFSHAVHRK